MRVTNDTPISRKRLQTVFEQLAHDRKLEILSHAAKHEQFAVTTLKDDLGLPHTTAHDYCRELHQAGLLHRKQMKPATYTAVDFDIHLSLDAIATAVEAESETTEYMLDTYGDSIIDELLDVWERVEDGDLTYREASGVLEIQHADFLRLAAELELFTR
ncbi:helix-turn-helix domain-containing protein [Haladaptatus caseinilyticus]|uniref:helix-turn-helix domain-containing protein n=1 Tax=Haladaptatus caseinilyticus TaxID=2993314 RepID=UPI00224A9294|nr:helix-turn-helix domain-containing protein [Haladaptatus caseinilyticus]